jgi:hypothetical protein
MAHGGAYPDDGFVGLYGAPGSGKSFVALDWAMCISEGRPWLGRYPTTRTPVVYVAAEGGRGIQQRVQAWMQHHGVTALESIYFRLHPIYIREEGAIETFVSELDGYFHQELEDIGLNPGLLVLDTLSRSFGAGDENASTDMGHFVDRMTELAKEQRMATLIVHHTNATGSRERGHTSFRGAADAMFLVEGHKDHTGHLLYSVVKNDKQKDSEDAKPIYLQPTPAGRSIVFDWMDAPEKAARGPKQPAFMRKIDMEKVLATHPTPMSWSEWRLATGIDRDRFNRRLRQLLTDGQVIKGDDGRYAPMPANKDLV